MYLFYIDNCICVFFLKITNAFAQNCRMYLSQVATLVSSQINLVFIQIGKWAVLLAYLWTAFQSCFK